MQQNVGEFNVNGQGMKINITEIKKWEKKCLRKKKRINHCERKSKRKKWQKKIEKNCKKTECGEKKNAGIKMCIFYYEKNKCFPSKLTTITKYN